MNDEKLKKLIEKYEKNVAGHTLNSHECELFCDGYYSGYKEGLAKKLVEKIKKI